MKYFYMGIDVSKGYADFVILDHKKEVIERNFQLDDNFTGHGQLHKILKSLFTSYNKSELFVGIESTGGYENNWFTSFQKLQDEFPLHLVRLNPFGVKHHGQASMKRVITDKVSARIIADFLISHKTDILYDQEDSYAILRRNWKFLKLLSKQKVQLLNQLESLLYIANPELLQYCHDGIPQWVMKLIARYPTADLLSRAHPAKVAKIPYITRDTAKHLIMEAKSSVASASDHTIGALIRNVVKQIKWQSKTIKDQNTLLTASCELEEIELLKSFKGIGTYSAVGILIEIGLVERFQDVKKLASFFGLHPVFKISGDGIGRIRMSKQGRSIPRGILYMVTMSAISKNHHIKEIYHGLLKRGMHSMAAQGVIMHKILRIIYGMLKNKKAYDPEIDRVYRARMIDQDQSSVQVKTRRYQSLDERAPISRRQLKKRKEQDQSQNAKHQIRDQDPALPDSTELAGSLSNGKGTIGDTSSQLDGQEGAVCIV